MVSFDFQHPKFEGLSMYHEAMKRPYLHRAQVKFVEDEADKIWRQQCNLREMEKKVTKMLGPEAILGLLRGEPPLRELVLNQDIWSLDKMQTRLSEAYHFGQKLEDTAKAVE